ncbi:MAG TPA: TraR/DksA C4-type zinc finger protein [Candidatus Binatia bacterium]|nr:TraR/DksA C4-type zinc finger protein [Candidatus Binatia bacterium]
MDIEAARARLDSERSRLLDVLSAAGRGSGAQEGVKPDQLPAEQAAETLNRELDTSVEQRVRAELAEVEAALSRIDASRYGLCEICGQEIAEGRLEAMPAARYCVADQAKAEKGLRARSAR